MIGYAYRGAPSLRRLVHSQENDLRVSKPGWPVAKAQRRFDDETTKTTGDDAMTMTITELERSLRALRLSGMTATLENRALQVA
jgi:hypothetical protein